MGGSPGGGQNTPHFGVDFGVQNPGFGGPFWGQIWVPNWGGSGSRSGGGQIWVPQIGEVGSPIRGGRISGPGGQKPRFWGFWPKTPKMPKNDPKMTLFGGPPGGVKNTPFSTPFGRKGCSFAPNNLMIKMPPPRGGPPHPPHRLRNWTPPSRQGPPPPDPPAEPPPPPSHRQWGSFNPRTAKGEIQKVDIYY